MKGSKKNMEISLIENEINEWKVFMLRLKNNYNRWIRLKICIVICFVFVLLPTNFAFVASSLWKFDLIIKIIIIFGSDSPTHPLIWIKTKKDMLFLGFLAHLGQKMIFEFFHLATHHCPTDAPHCRPSPWWVVAVVGTVGGWHQWWFVVVGVRGWQ